MNWQPIETAPKDGEWYLFHYNASYIPVIDFWSDNKGGWMRGPTHSGFKYTHWTYLPNPPEDL